MILDSLNGVAYKDDSQIVDIRIIKKYTEDDERIEFELI
nr:RusA family crossover junction endodeoxyribonuclease [Clostridium perfringens]